MTRQQLWDSHLLGEKGPLTFVCQCNVNTSVCQLYQLQQKGVHPCMGLYSFLCIEVMERAKQVALNYLSLETDVAGTSTSQAFKAFSTECFK